MMFLARSIDFEDESPLLTVREVYQRTVNLEDPRSGRRYSIVTSGEDMGPRTVFIKKLPSVSGGEQMVFCSGEIPGTYDPSLPPGRMNPRWLPLVSEWKGFLSDDLAVLKEPSEQRAFSELVGLGPGNTPAGDDYLAGIIIGVLWQGDPVPFSLEFWRTTWLSGNMLRDALEGKMWKRGKMLLEALSTSDPEKMTQGVGRIAAWGHSSGRAWLAGLSAAFSEQGRGESERRKK